MPRVAAHLREALGESRRAEILDAAVRLWLRDGVDGTAVDAIAREAGLAKGTLYLYFPSKEALLAEAIRRHSLAPVVDELAGALGERPLAETLPVLARELWRRLRANAPLVGLLFQALPRRPDLARTFLEQVVLPTNRVFAAYLERRSAAGELRPLDAFVAARALVGMLMIFLLTQEVFGGRALAPIDDDAITDTAAELFLRGMLRPPGDEPCPS